MLSRIFGEVTAIDISDEMVSRAQANTKDQLNVTVLLGDGATLADLPSVSFDFVFSFIVFQHISKLEVITSYCKDAHRILKPGGLFKFQIKGDTSIVGNADDTWTGYPISELQAERLARAADFSIEHAEGAGTQYYWLWFRKG
jgi:SAM-dependent methyltransferase